MLVSSVAEYVLGDHPLTREYDEAAVGSAGDSHLESIPPRYRDGRGGIDLARVRQDRDLARRQVVQSLMHNLARLWPGR